MAKGDSDTSAHAGQSNRPQLHPRRSTEPYSTHANESDSQVSDTASQGTAHQRPKHQKHVVGHGRLSSRVPSSKALQKSQQVTSNAKLNTNKHHRRQLSYSPSTALNNALTADQAERPPMLSSAHRRTTSDVRLSRDASASNLKKNTSHTSLKHNKSHVEVAKKSKSAANIKRSSSHKEVNKLKATNKTSVHFDLGNDGQDDEWVDASASASPYLSRRGSVISSGQGSAKQEAEEEDGDSPSQTPPKPPTQSQTKQTSKETPERERVQHKEYLTSRLLQRTPSHGAPPKMSSETVQVHPRSISPDSAVSRVSSTLYDSPKPAAIANPIRVDKVGTPGDELTSRFVSGPGSGVNPATGSFFSPTRAHTRVKRPQSLGNLHQDHRSSATDDAEEDDTSALAPRTGRSSSQYKAPPADKSRTQQKLNLQRASSTIEPVPAGGGGVGAVGASPLLGGAAYDNRDPRIGKLIERTGQEYLVVRRYQNPIARSISRLQQLPGANKTQHIPKQNGVNGLTHGKKPSETGGNRYGLGSSVGEAHRSQPATPKQHNSIKTNGANSSYETEGNTPHLSGGGYVEGDDDGVAALLRNLWDKNLDLSASQD
ncbi:hypothetical protein BKA67DRAFT_539398 [Truncatella angustata]|uniref:Uncharacterized protein n=1 Tax=Truncatella angustata TaxID=152316 RepID=A0A9P8UAN9_9PEZI|nr:uncharacterized protein BKA67DRAFT_539398 [Truncatella angustata]KAH6647541.1 hypothetical protein BKA67DRAFT_539398 [Truncatella angustata]KAH8205343.1 hypothetical protein TruAng_000422 [Truncatella angustata]